MAIDAGTAGIVITAMITGGGLILKYVPVRSNNGNGNGYKAALAEHNANCEVKGVVSKHEVCIAILTTKLDSIESGIKEIKEIIK